MNSIILAFDDEDGELGDFFSACNSDLSTFLEGIGEKSIQLPRHSLNQASIQLITQQHKFFLFGAYSHGSDNSLVVESVPYISTEINIDSFGDSFFYACACHTGKVLGQELINKGCGSFIGYRDKFTVWGFNIPPFVECANHGLKEFIKGKSVSEVLDSMVQKYNHHIDNYENDSFGAVMLVSNRNALIRYGKDLTISAMGNA